MKSSENAQKVMILCNFHENVIFCRNSGENQHFRVTETPESAESTKPYKFLGQINGIPTRNHFFAEIHHFQQNMISRANHFPRGNLILHAKLQFPAARALGMSFWAYVLCFKT